MSSNGITYQIFMDAAAVEAEFVGAAELFPGYVNRWLLESAMLTKAEMSANAPEGVAGVNGQGLKNHIGITHDQGAMTVVIKPDDSIPYADAVETGSRPHMPPTDPDGALAQWCEMKGLKLWAVARSIATKGTKPHPYIEPTFRTVEPQVGATFGEGVAMYIERMQYAGGL